MPFKDLHILVVDDSALQRTHLVDLLHSLQAGDVRQAGDDREALRLVDTVKLSGLSPKQLILEVTESEVIRDLAKALGTLARLRMKGFGLAIDDYGTGYSSMQQLSMIPFTELKLDRSLVHGIAHDAGLRVIVESALEMSRRLGLSTVAEGIESEADWRILAQLNCELVQGYAVARPMPAADLLPWWRETAPALRETAQRLAAASPPS